MSDRREVERQKPKGKTMGFFAELALLWERFPNRDTCERPERFFASLRMTERTLRMTERTLGMTGSEETPRRQAISLCLCV
jgi:hypothetical protein